jgi:hypothetical protein
MWPGRDTAASVTAYVHKVFMSSESNLRRVSVGRCHTRLGRQSLARAGKIENTITVETHYRERVLGLAKSQQSVKTSFG